MKKILRNLYKFSLVLTVCTLIVTGIADGFSSDVIYTDKLFSTDGWISYQADSQTVACSGEQSDTLFQSYDGAALLFGSVPVKAVDIQFYEGKTVYAGGFPFGVKLFTDGIIIAGFSEIVSEGRTCTPAYEAGLRKKDVITAVNGQSVSTAEEVTALIESSEGKTVRVTYRRGKKTCSADLKPVLSDESGKYQTGMWIRDNTAGIGTVTFYIPESGMFGGLGHGICDPESGTVLPMLRGLITEVKISGIQKGARGKPGELRGYFSSGKTGTLLGNTECGVFGTYEEAPRQITSQRSYEFGFKEDLQEGSATIICTLDENGPKEYTVEISSIAREAKNNKCFVITVTDRALLQKTGGIVQGMSGSPIIQGGKLVGAVTHVLVNDPTKGYGIFIENMLAAAR